MALTHTGMEVIDKRLLSVVGLVCNQQVVFLIDSGASNNFMSLEDAKKFGLKLQQCKPTVVKLADGKKLKCNQYVEALVSFGKLQCFQRFEILEANVVPIFGYTFLQTMNPVIDWDKKAIYVQLKSRKVKLPTLVPDSEVMLSKKIKTSLVEHGIGTTNSQCLVQQSNVCFGDVSEGADEHVSVGPALTSCGSPGRRVSTCQRSAVETTHGNSCEVVSYRAFKKGASKNGYAAMYIAFLDSATQDEEQQLNFTHRSAHGQLGHGDQSSLQQEADSMLAELKQKYSQVFQEPSYPICRDGKFQHKVKLVDESKQPPKKRLYPLDNVELEELKSQIQLFLDTNRIQPSSSPYGAPILFAKKKDGRLRMCIDYRRLNDNTVKDSFPLPRIDELMNRLNGAKYFSKLDLRDGYHQLEMAPEDRHKTAFTTRYGTFEFLVMPFGLCNAPSTFQRWMHHVFFDLLDKGVLVYLDDVLIYTKTVEEHRALLRKVFAMMEEHKLFVKETKCAFFLESVEFLGVTISSNGMAMEQGKTEAIKSWPKPSNLNEVQQFLGLCNYYRKFVFRFSELASPLTMLTRKNVGFQWGEQQQRAFERLKQCLTDAPVLKLFNPSLETRLVCDASDFCVGAVLEQKHTTGWHPVEFISKRLSQAEQNMCATDREFVAIVLALEKLRHFLMGRSFVILTDHAALTYLKTKSAISRRQARWLDFLSEFDFAIEHVAGKRNVADYLTRIPGTMAPVLDATQTLGVVHVEQNMQKYKCVRFADVEGFPLGTQRYFQPHSFGFCSGPQPLQCKHKLSVQGAIQHSQLGSVITLGDHAQLFEHLAHSQHQCDEPWFLKFKSRVDKPHSGVHYRHGVLCVTVDSVSCPIVPRADHTFRHTILRELHCTPLGGHLGARKLLHLVKTRFYWENMHKDVEQFVAECAICQANKSSTQKPPGLLKPLDPPAKPFEEITMDFIPQLPLSERGFDCVFTIVDRFSKWVTLVPCMTNASAEDIAQLFFEKQVCVFGMPKKVVCDRDPKFMSAFWQSLLQLLDCNLTPSTAYHPQTDGQSERFNRSLEQIIRCFCSSQQSRWCSFLSSAQFALNSTQHAATLLTPFRIVFGYEPQLPMDHALSQLKDCKVPAANSFVQDRSQTLKFVRENLLKAAHDMKKYTDTHRRDLQFDVGDYVWLSTQNIKLLPNTTRKLAPKWCGPFEVLQRIGPLAYKLKLPRKLEALHPVFHVSQLKAHRGAVRSGPEAVFEDAEGEHFEVEQLKAHRGTSRRREYLVKWLGYPDHDCTWEPESHLEGAQQLLAEYKQQHNLQ